jgi:anti-sigma factor RsiW
MDCEHVRTLLRDHQEHRLSAEVSGELAAHLAACAACRQVDAEEQLLSELLVRHVPRVAAPAALKRQLAGLLDVAEPAPRTAARAARRPGLVWLAALGVLAAGVLIVSRAPHDARNPLVSEAVNDHLRVLYAEHPIEVPTSDLHQVRPWFTGRLDFAPTLHFGGDEEFPLLGAAVGYFVDRKAATFVFKHRLHTISLFMFRADRLDWPSGPSHSLGDGTAQLAAAQGFHVLIWQRQDLGFALVSDAEPNTLLRLGQKLVAER